MKKDTIINKLEYASTLVEQVKEINLLQNDYMEQIREENPLLNQLSQEQQDLLLLHELRRTNKAHILLNYDMDDKLRRIERLLDTVVTNLLKDNINNNK